MSTFVLILLSWLVIFGQNILQPQQHYIRTQPTEAIVQTVSQDVSAVVLIRGSRSVPGSLGMRGMGRMTMTSTEGTGFIIKENGRVLTNKHVVDDPEMNYTVITSDGRRYQVDAIKLDPNNDIAVVQIDPSEHENQKLNTVEIGDSNSIKKGAQIVALSDDPGNIVPSVLTGNILATSETIIAGDSRNGDRAEKLYNVIQTSLNLVPGNSGSPLFDENGKVVGINTATSTDVNNVSFAVPINAAKAFLDTMN